MAEVNTYKAWRREGRCSASSWWWCSGCFQQNRGHLNWIHCPILNTYFSLLKMGCGGGGRRRQRRRGAASSKWLSVAKDIYSKNEKSNYSGWNSAITILSKGPKSLYAGTGMNLPHTGMNWITSRELNHKEAKHLWAGLQPKGVRIMSEPKSQSLPRLDLVHNIGGITAL